MPSASFIVAPNELRPGAIEIKYFRGNAVDGRQQGRKVFWHEPPASNVHANRDRDVAPRATLVVNKFLQQIGGQVVDAIPAHVFQRIEHGGFAGSGHAGDKK